MAIVAARITIQPRVAVGEQDARRKLLARIGCECPPYLNMQSAGAVAGFSAG
jgi:hypothetical protein